MYEGHILDVIVDAGPAADIEMAFWIFFKNRFDNRLFRVYHWCKN